MVHVLSSASATHVVELTPVGRAAVAVVLVDGPGALTAVDECIAAARGRPLADVPIGRIVLGRLRAGSSRTPVQRAGSSSTPAEQGDISSPAHGEEVIVCCRSPNRVEVHCHGGVAAVAAVVERLTALGCRRTAWPDWARASDSDPIRVAARVALADATTSRATAILLDQYHGALGDAVRAAVAAIEVESHSDKRPRDGDSPHFAAPFVAMDAHGGKMGTVPDTFESAAETLDGVLAWREFGQHLTTPWQVVLAGPPNVGKSTLLNALAGYGRAIVSHVPGTTRDVVTFTTAIDGWPVQLADTAGLRDADDALEAAGVALADAALADADLLLDVHDVSAEEGAISDFGSRISDSGSLRSAIRNPQSAARLSSPKSIRNSRTRVLHVLNKCDLISTPVADLPAGCMLTSALTGAGIAALIAAIGRALVPHLPAAGAAVPFTAEQVASLDAARRAVDRCDARSARDALQALLAK